LSYTVSKFARFFETHYRIPWFLMVRFATNYDTDYYTIILHLKLD